MKKMNVQGKERPSVLFILTGLGRYSWWQMPFLKRYTFCASVPSLIARCVARLFNYYHGSCRCNTPGYHCKWFSVFGLYIGLCESGRKDVERSRRQAVKDVKELTLWPLKK
jgi:hypothetical protein